MRVLRRYMSPQKLLSLSSQVNWAPRLDYVYDSLRCKNHQRNEEVAVKTLGLFEEHDLLNQA